MKAEVAEADEEEEEAAAAVATRALCLAKRAAKAMASRYGLELLFV